MFVRKIFGLFSLGHLLLIATAVLVIYMGSSFVQQIGTHLQAQEELNQLGERLERERQEERLLEQQLQYVQSTEAVEAWARENGWAKPDEVSVVVVSPAGTPSLPEGETPQEGQDLGSGFEVWWDFFFSER